MRVSVSIQPHMMHSSVYDGEAAITISGEEYSVGKGETIIMPANAPHALRAVTPFKMMLVMIRA